MGAFSAGLEDIVVKGHTAVQLAQDRVRLLKKRDVAAAAIGLNVRVCACVCVSGPPLLRAYP